MAQLCHWINEYHNTPFMFSAALFKTRNPPRCAPADGWVKIRWPVCVVESYSAAKKNEIMTF